MGLFIFQVQLNNGLKPPSDGALLFPSTPLHFAFCTNQKVSFIPRYSATDHWIQESIKRIFNSGLYWAVGAAEKKMQTAISMLPEGSFLCFQGGKIQKFQKYCSVCTKKWHISSIHLHYLEILIFQHLYFYMIFITFSTPRAKTTTILV